jgi:hypothetical protein
MGKDDERSETVIKILSTILMGQDAAVAVLVLASKEGEVSVFTAGLPNYNFPEAIGAMLDCAAHEVKTTRPDGTVGVCVAPKEKS